MMSLGSLATGITAQLLGGYQLVGPMGFVICLGAIVVIWPLARRLDASERSASRETYPGTSGCQGDRYADNTK